MQVDGASMMPGKGLQYNENAYDSAPEGGNYRRLSDKLKEGDIERRLEEVLQRPKGQNRRRHLHAGGAATVLAREQRAHWLLPELRTRRPTHAVGVNVYSYAKTF